MKVLVRCLCIVIVLMCGFSQANAAPQIRKVVVTVNNIQLTDSELDQEIQKILPSYRGIHGTMSQEKLDTIRNDAMKKIIEMELFYQDALAKGMKLSPTELKGEMNVLAQRFNNDTDFNAAIIAAGFTKETFSRFVERNILASRIFKKEVLDQMVINDQSVKSYYDKNVSRYNKPQEFRASHILLKVDPAASESERVAVLKKAEALLRRINEGADFSSVASEESDDLSRIKGGDIGFFHEGQALPEFDVELQKMKVGEVSKVLETIYGYHIIKLTDKKLSRQVPFDEIKDKIRNDLEELEKKRLLENWVMALTKKAVITYPTR